MATNSPDQTDRPKDKTIDAGKESAAKSPLVFPANAVDMTAQDEGAIYGFAFPMSSSSKKRVPIRGSS